MDCGVESGHDIFVVCGIVDCSLWKGLWFVDLWIVVCGKVCVLWIVVVESATTIHKTTDWSTMWTGL